MITIVKQALEASISYDEYLNDVIKYVEAGETSGPHQTQILADYTKLNLKRMRRLGKTTVLDEKLIAVVNAIPFSTKWIAITEAWCGDAAQNLPVIAALADVTGVELRIIYRDENPAFMDLHLTYGSRSIPKLIIYKEDGIEEIASWGPRPAEVQRMVLDYKKLIEHSVPFDTFAIQVHEWYTKNKGLSLMKELTSMFSTLTESVPTQTDKL